MSHLKTAPSGAATAAPAGTRPTGTLPTGTRPSGPWLPGLHRRVRRELGVAAAALGLAAALAAAWAGLGPWFPVLALVLFVPGAALVWRGLPWHPHERFGPANRVTLGRLAVTSLFAALALQMSLQPLADPRAMGWALVAVATVTAVVDAADGPLARASGLASEFGARFDMEVDALFMLVLCVLILQFDKTGPWVLAAGLMRYAFVAAAALPRGRWLAGPLPPSTRRKTVCVLQIVALIFPLGPIIPPAWSSAIAGSGLALLTYSFAVDVAWLARARHAAASASSR
jgi:phosphatidylglycerophosphate synthase